MAPDLQRMSDRLEIQDLMISYCTAVDSKDFALFRQIFTEDAVLDFTVMRGPRSTRDEMIAYLSEVMPHFPMTQHLVSNCRIWLDGDQARARTMCHNPMSVTDANGREQVMFLGLWYADRLVRTPEGWRICERIEQLGYEFNVPQEFRDLGQ